jgi:hypothetical protein
VFRPFVAVLAVREARWPLLASFLGALPIGMLSLSVLLLVQIGTGSPAAAGAVAAAVAIGNAVGLTVQGAHRPPSMLAGAMRVAFGSRTETGRLMIPRLSV